MTARRLVPIVVLLAALAVVWLVGFRCTTVRNGQTLCYSWFRPHILVLTSATGREFLWAVIDSNFPPPKNTFIDFNDDGVIDDFLSVGYSRYGQVFAHEISRAEDGRIDLAVTFHGRALTRADAVDVLTCRTWSKQLVNIRSGHALKQVCLDPSAIRHLTAAVAREVVEALRIPRDRDFVKGAMRQSKGQPLKTGLLYM